MRQILFITFLLTSASIAPASTVDTSHAIIGCILNEDRDRLRHIANPEVQELAKALVKDGRCRWFKPGEKIYVEKQEHFRRCIVPRGGSNCFWVLDTQAVPFPDSHRL